MSKLKLRFALFALFLAILFGVFIRHSLVQIGTQESKLWESTAEQSYNHLQARISDFLTTEDARPFSDYSASPNGPLALAPSDDPRGLIGYFQITPGGAFSSPHDAHPDSFSARGVLRTLTASLSDIPGTTTALKNTPRVVDLGTLSFLKKEQDKKDEESKAQPSAVAESAGAIGDVLSLMDVQQREQSVAQKQNQFYPNPLLEQKKKAAPRSKSSVADDDFKAGTEGATGGALQKENLFSANTPIAPPTPAAKPKQRAMPPEFVFDPFRARLIDDTTLVFYRRAWRSGQSVTQGFAVTLAGFYDWLMLQSFDASELKAFATARLVLESKTLLRRDPETTTKLAFDDNDSGMVLFSRQLGYPLNEFVWSISGERLPESPARRFLLGLSCAVGLGTAAGLALLYRTAAAEVFLSQKRQDFVAAVTHELKTPLTAIRMSADVLREGWLNTEDKKREYYDVIANEGERLGRLVDDVLQLARLEKRTFRFEFITESPNVFFEGVAKELGVLVASHHGFLWSAVCEKNLPAIRFDPAALKQILFTLIDNAVKFSQHAAEKSISLTVEKDGDDVVFAVSDQGPGVPEHERVKIFTQFYRAENELTRKTKGTGIGLAMAKMLSDGMDALILATHRKDATGAVFQVRFKSL